MGRLPPLLLVGGGKMGGAMLAGWREQGLERSVVVDPGPAAQSLAGADATVVASLAEVPAGFVPGCVVLAVKPQVANEVLPRLAGFAGRAPFVSIMAGRSVAGMAAALGSAAAIVRAMPNTPAAIRQGVTAAYAARGVAAPQRALADRLLSAIGTVAWVEDEALLDPVTAVSGSGPAYVFLLAELMERAAIAQGLPPDLARVLVHRTIAGSGALLLAGGGDPAELRRAVTSPGGTTERALAVLMDEAAWPRAVDEAIEAATARSRALAG